MTASREIAGKTVLVTVGAVFIDNDLADRLIKENEAYLVSLTICSSALKKFASNDRKRRN
jgi:hypothetical protein